MKFNKSITVTVLALSVLYAAGCSNATNKSAAANKSNISLSSENKLEDNSKSSQASAEKQDTNSKEKTPSANGNSKDKVSSEKDITERVKNYILNGQENKSEARKIKWTKTFLDKVDIKALYKQYLANGGRSDDLESFALYITTNAPIPSDWQELFKKDLYNKYGEKVVRLEHLQGEFYQAYVIKEGSEVPYVVVSSRTGYFHG